MEHLSRVKKIGCMINKWQFRAAKLAKSANYASSAFFENYMKIDLFSLYVLFSYFRPGDGTPENCFVQMPCYARACKTKGKFPGEHHVVWIGKTKQTS